ncbi:MAG: hypothetical protein MUE48_01040 [Desulfobacterales bacterium]|jgi:hypothetical protein|nr:hypothetical protein [Desulfobacterales bacterium]
MAISAAARKITYKTGKSFVLLFNRVSMYGVGHPYSVHAVDEFHRAVLEMLQITSPVVLIHARDQFFLEDEALDRSLNVAKMSGHFKKAGVSSVSIDSDVTKSELEEFVRVFLDLRAYPTADLMRQAAAGRGVTRIRINHVFYQKVTEDDQVVAREMVERSGQLDRELDSSREARDALGLIAGKLLAEEIDHGAGLQRLLADPAGFAQGVLQPEGPGATDLGGQGASGPGEGGAAPGGPGGGGSGPGGDGTGAGGAPGGGGVAAGGPGPGEGSGRLAALRGEVLHALQAGGGAGAGLAELAEALVKMRSELLAQIDARKALGLAVEGEQEIRETAASLSDAVVIQLVRQEYDCGRTPVDRLAFILHRLVPGPEDLGRMLPALREALMADGMSGPDFMALLGRLGLERQEESVVQALREGADSIGLSPGDLLSRLTADPSGFARFLYLASEIERESGSRKPLCDILVEHLERVGSKLASGGDPGGEEGWFRDILRRFNMRAVEGLRGGPVDPELVDQVERRLTERLEASVQSVRAELTARGRAPAAEPAAARTLLQRLEDGLPPDHELKQVLSQVRAGLGERRENENDFARILEAVEKAREAMRKPEKAIDEIVFGRKHTVSLLDIEIARATRYGTDLSGIVFSIYRGAGASSAEEAAPTVDMTVAILQKLRDKLRNTDWIGIVNSKLFLAVMPMTTPREAHLATRRLLRALNADPVTVGGRPVPFKLAGSVAHFDRGRMRDSAAFLQHAQAGHAEVAHRLRNLQDFM